MSASHTKRAILPPDIKARKGQTPLVVLTAYTTPMAKLIDQHCDIALIGDSLGMVIYGMSSTLGVSMQMMVEHGKAVVRGLSHAMPVIDMPFGSYEESPEQAFRNASYLLAQTGAAAVKLEGGETMAETISFLSARGIPVMAHVGLTPQSVNTLGGYKVVGRDHEAHKVMGDARSCEQAQAFAIVLEKIPRNLAAQLTREISIPTIGIGAGPDCDGQVLVLDDMLGLFSDFKPKFVKRYGSLGDDASRAIAAYADDVRSRSFPGPEHSFADDTDTSKHNR